MSEATPPAPQDISPEFFIRVNDFIEMANRIERRFDTHHAISAMTHAFGRYSAHHYRTTIKGDDQQTREDFADFIGETVKRMIATHIDSLSGPLADKPDSNDAPAE